MLGVERVNNPRMQKCVVFGRRVQLGAQVVPYVRVLFGPKPGLERQILLETYQAGLCLVNGFGPML